MRMVVAYKVILSEDNDQLQRDIDINQVIDDSTPSKHKGSTYDIAPGVVNQQFAATPEMTAVRYLLIQVRSGSVTIRLNDATAPAIGLAQNPPRTPDPHLPYQKHAQDGVLQIGPITSDNPITSIYVSNPGTVAARIAVSFVGQV